jgi:hypothetical protein
MSIDPKRIVEDEGASPLAAMLRAARDDGLTPEEVDRVRAGVAATIAAGVATTALGVKHAGMLASLPAKVGLALAVVGVAAGGAWLARKDVVTLAARPAAPWHEATAPWPGTSEHPGPPAPPSDPVQSPPSLPAADIAASPSAAKASQQPRRSTPAASTTPTPPRVSGAPANEGALLLEARRALDDDPARALELVHEHGRQFPNSQLAPERARIEAEAATRGAR